MSLLKTFLHPYPSCTTPSTGGLPLRHLSIFPLVAGCIDAELGVGETSLLVAHGLLALVLGVGVGGALVVNVDWLSSWHITKGHVAKVHEWEGEPLVASPQGQAGVSLFATSTHRIDNAHSTTLLEEASTFLTLISYLLRGPRRFCFKGVTVGFGLLATRVAVHGCFIVT